jgi:hypothetical protein
MPRKPPKTPAPPKPRSRKPDDREQFQRFIATARKIGVDGDPEALDRAFDKIAPRKAS